MASSKGSALNQLEDTLNLYFGKKAPQIPDNIKELIVKLAPWLVIIGLIMSLPAILVLFGISSFYGPASFYGSPYGPNLGGAYWVSTVILAVALVLQALAIPGLFSRSKKGWNLTYYSALVSIVSSLVTLNILGAIISALISFYILFQIKSYYK